ncbi:hypothetical protein AgCh_023042 [Apium graveolens]
MVKRAVGMKAFCWGKRAARKGMHSGKDAPVIPDFLTIEVETVDRYRTFLGSLWVSESNMAMTLLEHGLVKLQTSFNTDKIKKIHQLAHAKQSAKRQKLKIWKSYVERRDVPNDQYSKRILKEVLQVIASFEKYLYYRNEAATSFKSCNFVATKLFGGSALTLQYEAIFRGDINIFLLSDRGTSKSQLLLTYTDKLSLCGIYTSGRGSSVVGLTAYVAKDPESGDIVYLQTVCYINMCST